MATLYVDQIMSRPVETIAPDASVREAAGALIEHDVGAILVVDDENRLEGILTTTDFVLLVRDGTPSSTETVSDFMRTDVLTTERNAPVSEVVDAMRHHRIHHVPVVDGEEVVGMVTAVDVAVHAASSLEP